MIPRASRALQSLAKSQEKAASVFDWPSRRVEPKAGSLLVVRTQQAQRLSQSDPIAFESNRVECSPVHTAANVCKESDVNWPLDRMTGAASAFEPGIDPNSSSGHPNRALPSTLDLHFNINRFTSNRQSASAASQKALVALRGCVIWLTPQQMQQLA